MLEEAEPLEAPSVFVTTHSKLLLDIVDTSLKGSEYGMEAWKIFRKHLVLGRALTGEELEQLDELVDRAKDDIEGPGLRVDFSKDRIY